MNTFVRTREAIDHSTNCKGTAGKRVARRIAAALVFLAAAAIAAPAFSQTPDTILVNGKILTVDAQFSTREALAIHDGKILALGSSAEMRKTAGPKTRVIDLQGRTVIPGLIDDHMHAIRAALSFSTEVNWIGAKSLAEGLARIHEASQRMRPGAWLIVVTPPATLDTFKEKRPPTQAELLAVAPDNPVYVQLGYGSAILTPAALRALNIKTDADLPERTKLELDGGGKPSGVVTGNMVALFDRLPKPNFDEEVAGTKEFFRELNRLGMTGVVDPGGNNVEPEDYQAIFKVWKDHQMTIRVAYSLCGMTPGSEFEEYKRTLALMPMGFGDDMLRFNGLGERITWAMNAINGEASDADHEKYYEIVRWAAQQGMTVTMHWGSDKNVDQLLTIWERVNREFPIANLRWTVAHLNDASTDSLRRMKALGVGWTVQDQMYNSGDQVVKQGGAADALRMPPVMTAKKIGVMIAGGTDAHRVSTYNPFTVLQWFLDGRTASGAAIRGPEETPTREDALRFYTMGSAWVANSEKTQGSLQVGKFADLAVLSKPYMTAPVSEIGDTVSLLTMVNGKIVYAAAPYAQLEQKAGKSEISEATPR